MERRRKRRADREEDRRETKGRCGAPCTVRVSFGDGEAVAAVVLVIPDGHFHALRRPVPSLDDDPSSLDAPAKSHFARLQEAALAHLPAGVKQPFKLC